MIFIIQFYVRQNVEKIKRIYINKQMAKTKKSKKSYYCPSGQIMRDAYVRKDGTRVKATCIKDRGKPGKGPKLFTVKKGGLSKHGYRLNASKRTRHQALGKARKKMSYSQLISKLNAIRILHRNTNPSYSRKIKNDMDWLKETRKSKKKG